MMTSLSRTQHEELPRCVQIEEQLLSLSVYATNILYVIYIEYKCMIKLILPIFLANKKILQCIYC
jgi:hypothetical protein